MPAPQRLFFDFTEEEVLAIRNKAKELITQGKVLMEVSAGGKSGRNQFAMPPREMLAEANAALKHINPAVYGKRKRFTVSRVRSCHGY